MSLRGLESECSSIRLLLGLDLLQLGQSIEVVVVLELIQLDLPHSSLEVNLDLSPGPLEVPRQTLLLLDAIEVDLHHSLVGFSVDLRMLSVGLSALTAELAPRAQIAAALLTLTARHLSLHLA